MQKKLLLIVIFNAVLLTVSFCQEYKAVLNLQEHNFDHLSEYYTYWLQPFTEPEDASIADSMYNKSHFKHWKWHKSLSLGDARQRLWIRVVVSNQSKANTKFVWSIHDFMDTANLYISNANGFEKIATGTYWYIAKKRAFNARPLCLPFSLQYQDTKTLYLCINQHNNNLYFPLKIRNVVDFLQEEENFIIRENWFWLVGFYVFSLLFNLILFCFLREKIYLWYCFYVFLNIIFLLMEDSLDDLILPQWLYSFIWNAGQYIFLLLSTATGIKIMQSFTAQSVRQPYLYKCGNILFLISFCFVALVFFAENYFSMNGYFSLTNLIKSIRDILIFVNLFFIILSLFIGFRQRNKLAYYYGVTYSFFFISCLMFMLNHLGITSINLVQPNILAWGLFFELLTLSILLIGRFEFTIKSNSYLQVKNIELEKDQIKKLLATQEAERKRIAEDLHDDLGPTLSALQLHISNAPHEVATLNPEIDNYFQKALFLTAKANADVRNISHALLPKDFEEQSLLGVLQNRIDELNAIQNIQFRLITSADEKRPNSIYNITLYRIINELIINIIRHSQASEATVQVFLNELETQILVEDNGIGIENAIDKKGIGLKNIKSRVDFLKGEMHIDSSKMGTSFIIQIPVSDNGGYE